ncbi:MAG: hypothetical protein ACIAQZ_15755 [Sedimentisphaeraceae bacterium JB056]
MKQTLLLLLAVLFTASVSISETLIIDEIDFGSYISESVLHNTTLVNCSGGTGAMGLSYRRMNNYTPARDYGGKITFNIAVDPTQQNYFTLKLWGSDYCQSARSSQMYLYYEGKQVGYRMHADWTPLDANWEYPEFPDRFYYTTYMLPLSITQGKSEVVLTIESWGYWWPYGGNWDECQNLLEEPSRAIYNVYTHADPYFEPSESEPQGQPVELGDPRSDPGQYESALAKLIEDADDIVGTRKVSQLPLGSWKMTGLARAYNAQWSAHFQDPVIISKLVTDFDHWVSQVASESNKSISDDNHDDWSGYGRLAIVLLEMLDHFESQDLMDVMIDHDNEPSTADMTRRRAYAEFFRDGRDWRMLDRRYITNQVLDCEISIYLANKILQQLDPTMAWDESYAIETVYEAVGLLPYGDWAYGTALDTDYLRQQIIWNADSPYYMITEKGLSRETGYVAYYGNVCDAMARLAEYTGDIQVKQQAIKFVQARAPFRFFDNDEQGYQCMRIEAAVGTRHINETGHIQYGDWTGFETAAALQDPVSVRLAQIYLEHNRFWFDDIDIEDEVKRVNDYITVASLPQSSYQFPMEPDAPDYAWADEDDCVVAVKRGNVRFYANMYFRMPPAINNIGRVHYTTPSIDRVANVYVNCEFTPTGLTMTREENPASPERSLTPAPAELGIQSYHAGEILPTAEGALPGRAEFYHFRYGDFLVAMNTTGTKSFTLPIPAGVPQQAWDMIASETIDTTGKVTVEPRSTLVLFIGDPGYCGDSNTVYLEADINKDCIVDLLDLSSLASFWLYEY